MNVSASAVHTVDKDDECKKKSSVKHTNTIGDVWGIDGSTSRTQQSTQHQQKNTIRKPENWNVRSLFIIWFWMIINELHETIPHQHSSLLYSYVCLCVCGIWKFQRRNHTTPISDKKDGKFNQWAKHWVDLVPTTSRPNADTLAHETHMLACIRLLWLRKYLSFYNVPDSRAQRAIRCFNFSDDIFQQNGRLLDKHFSLRRVSTPNFQLWNLFPILLPFLAEFLREKRNGREGNRSNHWQHSRWHRLINVPKKVIPYFVEWNIS